MKNISNNIFLFCEPRVLAIQRLIQSSTTTSILGIPGAGISIFLKYLASQPFGFSVYVDAFGLPNQTSIEFFKNLLYQLDGKVNSNAQNENDIVIECKKALEKLIQKNEKVIIYIGGFDQLDKSFNQEFFHHLRSLRNVNLSKVVFIFGICKKIDSLLPENLKDIDLHMFSSTYYLKPYSNNDLRYILELYGPKIRNINIEKTLNLCGGHFQLLQLLLNSERLHDPLNDPFINLSLKNIYQYLTYKQKKILKKIAIQEVTEIHDEYLINIGLIQKIDGMYKIFSPLFEQFLKSQISVKLPIKEARLLTLLKENFGKIVSKNKIFEVIWENENNNTSDWALDALIYRLRKHPAFLSQGYIIESQKKQGYILLKN